MKKIILFIILVLIIFFCIYNKKIKNEDYVNIDMIGKGAKPRELIIVKNGIKTTTNFFRYKAWNGSMWTAKIIGDAFEITKRNTNETYRVKTIEILRFRSMTFYLIINKDKLYIFRADGLRGICVNNLDLIDWDDETQNIRIIYN